MVQLHAAQMPQAVTVHHVPVGVKGKKLGHFGKARWVRLGLKEQTERPHAPLWERKAGRVRG